VRAKIERTRRRLGDTVAALADKTDVNGALGKGLRRQAQRQPQAHRAPREGAAVKPAEGDRICGAAHRRHARDTPVATAALAAFVGGLIAGRLEKAAEYPGAVGSSRSARRRLALPDMFLKNVDSGDFLGPSDVPICG